MIINFIALIVPCIFSEMIRMTDRNFNQIVNMPGATLVKFYTNECSHCKELRQPYAALAQSYDHIPGLRFAECNLEDAPIVQDQLGIEFVPEVMWFTPLNNRPIQFEGEKNFGTLVGFLNYCARQLPF